MKLDSPKKMEFFTISVQKIMDQFIQYGTFMDTLRDPKSDEGSH